MTSDMAIAAAGSTHHAAGTKRTMMDDTMVPALLMTSLTWSSASALMDSERDASHLHWDGGESVWSYVCVSVRS